MTLRRTFALLLASVLLVACGKQSGDSQNQAGSDAGAVLPPSASNQALPLGDDPRLQDLNFLRGLPPTADVEIAIGNLYFKQGAGDSAVAAYRRAVALEPEAPRALNYLGIALAKLGRHEEAEAAYTQAAKIDPFDYSTLVNLGNLRYRQEDYRSAVATYRRAISVDSTQASAWMAMAYSYEKMGSVNEAILAYNKAAVCDDDDPEPWERLGNIYSSRMLYKAARERWAEAVLRDPSRTDLKENIRTLEEYADSTGTR